MGKERCQQSRLFCRNVDIHADATQKMHEFVQNLLTVRPGNRKGLFKVNPFMHSKAEVYLHLKKPKPNSTCYCVFRKSLQNHCYTSIAAFVF